MPSALWARPKLIKTWNIYYMSQSCNRKGRLRWVSLAADGTDTGILQRNKVKQGRKCFTLKLCHCAERKTESCSGGVKKRCLYIILTVALGGSSQHIRKKTSSAANNLQLLLEKQWLRGNSASPSLSRHRSTLGSVARRKGGIGLPLTRTLKSCRLRGHQTGTITIN